MNYSPPRIIAWIVEVIVMLFNTYLYFNGHFFGNLFVLIACSIFSIWTIESTLKSYVKYSQPGVEVPKIKNALSALMLTIFGFGSIYWAYRDYLNGETGRSLFNLGFGLFLLVVAFKGIAGNRAD